MQLYVKHFVMTGWQVRGVQVTSDSFCDNWVASQRCTSYNLCDKVCDDCYCTLILMLFICVIVCRVLEIFLVVSRYSD